MTWDIIREALSYLITGISTAIAGGTFMFFKAKRKIENQKARQEENTADSGRFQNLQAEIKYLDDRIEKYRKQQVFQEEQSRRMISGMQKIVTVMIGQKKYAEFHLCEDVSCSERIPTLGSFKSKDIEELIEYFGKNEKESM